MTRVSSTPTDCRWQRLAFGVVTSPPRFSTADLEYIRTEYHTLEELCVSRRESPEHVGELISSGRLPRPTYVLPAGSQWFPPDYFALVDAAGGVDELPVYFRVRYTLAAARAGLVDDDAEETWTGYLSGLFGVCLWTVSPESMALKTRLIADIEALTTFGSPSDRGQVVALRVTVDALDQLERPFTDYDRARWGGTSRTTYIDQVRETYLR